MESNPRLGPTVIEFDVQRRHVSRQGQSGSDRVEADAVERRTV